MDAVPLDAEPPLSLRTGHGRVTVAGLPAAEKDRLRAAWSRCAPEDGAPDVEPHLSWLPGADWDQFHENLVFQATSAAVESGRGTHLMLHAACLAVPESGAALALAAASGTGKTTATRRLGPHFAYLTDETAMVDPQTLEITPYAKPLSVLGPEGTRPKTQHGPDELGLGPTVPARLERVAVLDRVREPAGEVPAHAEAMGLVEALTALVPQTSSLSLLPRGLVTFCQVLDRLGGAQRLVYAEADDLRPVVEALLAEPAEPLAPAWEPLEEGELTASTGEATAGEGRIRRRAVDDGIITDDGVLVLLADTQLAVLEGLGPALWFLLDVPRTPGELVAALADQGPVPEDAAEHVSAALATLTEHGLVEG